jgi:hypothetical protein
MVSRLSAESERYGVERLRERRVNSVAPGRERLLVHLTVLAVNPIRRGSIRSKSGSQKSNPISLLPASSLRSKIRIAKSCALSASTIAKPIRLNGLIRKLLIASNPLCKSMTHCTLGCQITRNIFSEIGYRYLYDDFRETNFLYQLSLHGAQITVGLKF